jgi:hypothetical protein
MEKIRKFTIHPEISAYFSKPRIIGGLMYTTDRGKQYAAYRAYNIILAWFIIRVAWYIG